MCISSNTLHSLFLRTLELAKRGWGSTHPNPMVGALVVENGEVVAEGFHREAGAPHAEVEALRSIGRLPLPGASLFISLEPCSSYGRTPPCTEAIVRSGIKRVFVASIDPNPKHSGEGISKLRKAGVEVEIAGSEIQSLAERLNFIFIHNMLYGSPLIALKIAESANGMIAEKRGTFTRVTQEEALGDVMNWRALFPGICVGCGTILSDDPALTVRLPGKTSCPIRLILDSSLSSLETTVSNRKLFEDEFYSRTYVLTTKKGLKKSDRVARATKLGINLIELESNDEGNVSLTALPKGLKELGLNSLYCEGGARLGRALLEAGEVDYLFRYRSTKEFRGPDALPSPLPRELSLRSSIEKKLGPDELIHGFL